MAQIQSGASADLLTVDATSKAARTALYDQDGNPIFKLKNGAYESTDRFVQNAALDRSAYRPLRADVAGGQALAMAVPLWTYNLYTAALPPGALSGVSTQTITHATATGTLLNAGASGTANSHATMGSMRSFTKLQRFPLASRHRARLVKGGTNGQADIGLSGTFPSGALGSTVQINGFVFLYGSDGTLKPTVYANSNVIAQGADFASSVTSDTYYDWDVIVSDDSVTFFCRNPTTRAVVSEQTLNINIGDPRFGVQVHWFCWARSFVTTAAANVGAATQVYVADASVVTLDTGSHKPWPHIMAGMQQNSVYNPTVALAQLANYANSAAPASATLSNTAAGYTTLGGQFQFAAVAGAETDYALFAFSVPTGVMLHVTDIDIDTMNTGAAVATTATWLQWFCGDAGAVTLASNSFRQPLGNQVFPIGAAIGAQATPISRRFTTPFTVVGGRVFHIALKMPLGTATASQIIRGIVRVNGYFD